MDISKFIEKKTDEIKKEKEKAQKELAIENKPKEIIYKIASQNVEYKILDFIKGFDSVKNIQEIVPEKLYLFSLESEEDFDLIYKIFESYSSDVGSQVIINRSTKENYLFLDNPYITTHSDFNPIEDTKALYENPYDKQSLEEHELFLTLNPDVIKEKFAKFISSVYDNIPIEKSQKFVDEVYKGVMEFHEKHRRMGYLSDVSSYSIVPSIFAGEDDSYLSNMKVDRAIGKVCESITKDSHLYMKNHDESYFNKLLKSGKEASGITKFKITAANKWADTEDEQELKKLNNDLLRKIKEADIPSGESITGRGALAFFNYYNMKEREYSVERPLIAELANTFAALAVVKYREKVFSYFDKITNKDKGGFEKADDFFNAIDTKNVTVENFRKHIGIPVNKKNKLTRK